MGSRAAQGLQRLGTGRMIGVGMRANNLANVTARRLPQPLQVPGVIRAGVDGDVTGVRVSYQVAVGARARHRAGVGRGEANHVFEQTHRRVGAPIQVMHDLAIRADQFQLAKALRLFVFHEALFMAVHQATARATGP